MKMALVQMTASFEDIQLNQRFIINKIHEAVKQKVALICFPEMSLLGYNFEHMTERINKQKLVLERLRALAMSLGITIIVGGLEEEEGKYYISQFVISEAIDTYRKIHIGQREGAYVTSGDAIKVIQCEGIKIGLMLCYDGHFPEVATIMATQGADILFNPSASPNMPEKRVAMWRKYLTARAYDNRVWVAATNLRFKGKGGGMLVIDGDGQEVLASTVDRDDMMVFDYKPDTYSKTSMKKRDFKVDRQAAIYDKYR